ncbi:FAD:protein FMN transferase [Desulfococcus sp.]|uniref:FAD:protein FMN transferase n=1 Tax=Desulfococcus sp. TaxID=2025834 RepID=UPI003593495B
MRLRHVWLALLTLLMMPLPACVGAEQKAAMIEGKTMGTTFHITVVTKADTVDLERRINERLAQINRSMSTYDPESEISRFNQTDAGRPFPVSADFLQVMTVAAKLHALTDGAWDGTVNPLVNLWGFGSRKVAPRVPDPKEIDALLPDVGFRHITVSKDATLSKDLGRVSVDLASIAKGYGVDQAAAVISASGIDHFIVEIGGEVYAKGLRPDGKPWRIGINTPKPMAGATEVYKVVALSDRALATSGDYRIFFMSGGRQYAHILDPRTGRAVENGVVSASVIAPTCTFADGLATALVVMGPEKGLALVNRLPDVECLIIVEDGGGTFVEHPSRGFRPEP